MRAGRVQLSVWALHEMPMHAVQMLVFSCALALVCSEAGKAQFLSSGSPRAKVQSLGTDPPKGRGRATGWL